MDTVESLLGLRDKTPIEAVTATVKKVWPLENHTTGNFGPWTSQNIILTDGVNEITAGFVSREEVPQDAEGGPITLRSITSTQHGLVGLKTKAFRNVMQLAVTKTAQVTFESADEANGDAPAPPPRPAAARPATAHPASAPRPAASAHAPRSAAPAPRQNAAISPAGAVKEGKEFLNRCANFMELCLDAADFTKARYDEAHGGDGAMSGEQYQAIVSTFFIAGQKAGYVDGMPLGTLDEFKGGGPE